MCQRRQDTVAREYIAVFDLATTMSKGTIANGLNLYQLTEEAVKHHIKEACR